VTRFIDVTAGMYFIMVHLTPVAGARGTAKGLGRSARRRDPVADDAT
jgi:hypothetical protein